MKDVGAAGSVTIPFFCECSIPDCRGRIELSADTYERLHADKRRFVVVPGHEIPKIETVVMHTTDYDVVEKKGDSPRDGDMDAALRRLAL